MANLLDATLPDWQDQTGVSFFRSKARQVNQTTFLPGDDEALRELSALLGKSTFSANETRFDFEEASKGDLLLGEGCSFLADNTLANATMARILPSKKPKLSTMPEEENTSSDSLPDFPRLLPLPLTPLRAKKMAADHATPTCSMTGLLSKLNAQDGENDFLMNEASPIGRNKTTDHSSPRRSPLRPSAATSTADIPPPAPISPRSLFSKMTSGCADPKATIKSNYASEIVDSEKRIRALLSRTPSKPSTSARTHTPSNSRLTRPPAIYKESTTPLRRDSQAPVKRAPTATSTLPRSSSKTSLARSPSKPTLSRSPSKPSSAFQTPSKQASDPIASIQRSQQRSALRSQTYANFSELLTTAKPTKKPAATTTSISRSRTLTSLSSKALPAATTRMRQPTLPSSRSQPSLGALKAPSASQSNLARASRPPAIPAPPASTRKPSLQEVASATQVPLGSRYGFTAAQSKTAKPRTSTLPSSSSKTTLAPRAQQGHLTRTSSARANLGSLRSMDASEAVARRRPA